MKNKTVFIQWLLIMIIVCTINYFMTGLFGIAVCIIATGIGYGIGRYQKYKINNKGQKS